jgi:4-diphosphocytidyl-2-C-methyl-D-erythritol kinase
MRGSARTARTVVVRAHAKVNLTLHVLGRRHDGYHELQTIFQSVALHDRVTVHAVRGPFRFACDDPVCPSDQSNLVWRAAAALWSTIRRSGELRDVVIDLKKRIPMEAGLGGGSSDAAATLVALAKLWRVKPERLHDVAAALGADVPYFLTGGTALGLDRGDTIVPLPDLSPSWVTIVMPGFGVSTREAFAAWDRAALAGAAPAHMAKRGDVFNDLQPVVIERHPDIGRIVAGLRDAGASHAAMSGSGSAVFGLFERRTDAVGAARAVSRERTKRVAGAPLARVVVTRTLTRAQYQH